MERQTVRISIRNLVEFLLRSGDIDNRIAAADKDAMQMGARLHRKIQRQMGADYRAEVTLRRTVPCGDFDILAEGRADGIIRTEDGACIDEIKGIFKDPDALEEPVAVHLAQAKCYACIYAAQEDLREIGVQMTYCHLETEQIRRFRESYSAEELEAWFLDLIRQYEKWARFQIEWRKIRNASVRETEFPFAYREGQRELAAGVYRTILRRKKLFIQAPTGVGKTMAVVFPAVKAVGEGLAEKIFYLTAKTVTRTVARQAFETLKGQGLRYKAVTLTAKEKICFRDRPECDPDHCPYARGHFDRINDAVYDWITSADEMSRRALEEQAEKWKVCPFELGLETSVWADAVICDYNYVFDPNASLKRFFGEGARGDYLFLIDEAHNLVERGREMYSASLYKEEFLRVKRLVKKADPKFAGKLEECNRQLLELKRECGGVKVLGSAASVYLKLLSAMAEAERFLEECQDEELRGETLELYFEIRHFVNMYERLDENYMIYCELEPDGGFKLRLFCVNPAENLRQFLEKGVSTVFFSATLLPVAYYRKLLDTDPEDYAVYAQSSFQKDQRMLAVGTDVSTRYTMRGEEMYRRYAQYLRCAAGARKGNYMAFFPSYRFMEEVYGAFQNLEAEPGMPDVECILQAPYMSEEAREIFLESFEEEREVSLIGFCVMGGIFSEGINLARDRLIGAVIVGTGLPQVCRERELLREYFDAKGADGYNYAYVYPGMNKVQQAAGRVIRTEEDRGIILLLDGRFMERRYQETFPREWQGYRVCNIRNVEDHIREFWEETPEGRRKEEQKKNER